MITRDMSHNVDPVSELAKKVHVFYEFGALGPQLSILCGAVEVTIMSPTMGPRESI